MGGVADVEKRVQPPSLEGEIQQLIKKKSRIRETTNLSTDKDRHTDTEENIKKSSSVDLVRWPHCPLWKVS